MPPSFSIVIVAYGKRAVTEACLRSIDAAYGARLGREVELVLVDNASPDDTAELFAAWSDRATVLALEENRNFAGGYNAGARAASGETLVLLNNDTIVPEGALDALVQEALDPTVGIVGCRLTYPDGTLQHGGFGWRAMQRKQLAPFHLFHHEAAGLPAAAGIYDLDTVTGACMATRREVFLTSGGFDEAFVNGWEDVDLCLRLRTAGLRVVYRGDVAIVHAEGQTSGGDYGGDRNVLLFEQRWMHLLDDDAGRVAELFDAAFSTVEDPVIGPPRRPDGATTLVTGPITGLSPDAAEARALLAALEGAGLEPAGRDVAPVWLRPRLSDADTELLDRTLSRAIRPRSSRILVGDDPRGIAGRPSALRLAGAPAGPLDEGALVLAADRATAAAAVAAGTDPARVRVVAPAVPARPCAAGGEGLLVLLPAHDEARCAAVADALAGLDGVAITILPTAADRRVTLVAELLGAELLAPISAEDRFAELAGRFDVVLAADAHDRFGRRALVAAATGSAPVVLDPTPAADVLGDLLVTATPGTLAAAVRTALADARRRERSEAVREHCDPAAAAAAVDALLRDTATGAYAEVPDGKAVLFVAPAPPTHDRDSGSLRLFRFLRILVGQGVDVTFAAHGHHGLERYVDDLERLGIEVYAGDPDVGAIVTARHYDLAVLTPFHVAERHLDTIRLGSPSTKILIDTVDLHHVRERRAAELSGDADALATAEETARRERWIYSRADGLIAVSDDERQALEAFVPGVPTGTVSNIHGAEPVGGGFDEREGLVFVAGFGHPPNVDAALWFCREVLPHVRSALPGVPVRIVGSNPPAEIRALARDGVEVTGWVPETTPYLLRSRVSIAPLRYGAGVKGKVGEALAHGLPVVTTSVGSEGMALVDGEHVLVADDPEAFAAAVVRAHTDRTLWERLRTGGRERLLERLGPGPALAGWHDLVRRVVDGATFVAIPPPGDEGALTSVLRSYLGAFSGDDPVSLVLGLRDVSPAALQQVGAVIAGLGHDPLTIPDVMICPDTAAGGATAAWRVSFDDGPRRGRVISVGSPEAFRAAVAA